MSAVYLAGSALDQLRDAQSVLDDHITCSATGRCRRCQAVGPCDASQRASSVFVRYGQLPRRRPGATQPELVNARRLATTR